MHENPSLVNFFIFPKKNQEQNIIDSIPNQKVSSFFFSSSTSNDSCLSPLSLKSPYHIINIFEKDYPQNEQSYEFFIFNYLMNYYFRAGNQGDYALTAISILLDLDIDLLYKFLLNNNFPLVITASLCGSYNALPTNRESGYLQLNEGQEDDLIYSNNKEFEEALKLKLDKEKQLFDLKYRTFRAHIINDELNIFLRIFQFIQKITTDCKEQKIVDQFLYYFKELFIKNVLNNQFFTSKKIGDEDYSRIFYLKLIINNLQSPILAQLFFNNLFPEVIHESGDNESDAFLKKIDAICNEYKKMMMEHDKVEEESTDENENENGNENEDENGNDEDKDEIMDEETANGKIRKKRLLSTSINERLENQLNIIREIEQAVTDENYYREKFKSMYEISPKIALHYAKESALSKFSTQQMNLASISQNIDSVEEPKNLYSYIVSRLKSESQGLRLVTLQLVSILLRKQNTVATHKLFPCYYGSSQDNHMKNGSDSSVNVQLDSTDIDIKGIREEVSVKRRKELETEYLKLFHCIYHFKRLFEMNMDYLSRHLITDTTINPKNIKIENLQLNRYFNLFNSIQLRNINSRIFIYPYILEVSSSIQYNKFVDKAYTSILSSFTSSLPLPGQQQQQQQQPSSSSSSSSSESEASSAAISSYVKIPSEVESLEHESSSGVTAEDSADLFAKILNKEKLEDILSIMKGFQGNQLLQCLFDYLRNWLDNPYEINLVVSGIFHELLSSADHLFLGQYLIMGDQLLSKEGSGSSNSSLFTILQELIQKINKNYDIIKTSTKINLLYLSMYEKLGEINENIRLRGRSTYITLESAVDVSIICDYDDFLNAPMESEGAKEFEALLQTLDDSGRQDLLNMFKISTIKNIIILMEFLKDIIAALHVQFEEIALS
eukprot:jgi/Orpsp1_1/1179284/evm.model.c7180000068740.2